MPDSLPAPPASRPAGLLRRLAAMLYDTLLLFAVLFFATVLLLPLTGGEAIPAGNPLFAAYLIGVSLMFFVGFWIHGGQTLGMRAWKIRVQRADNGNTLTWSQALLRCLAAILALVPAGAGYWWMLIDKNRRTWHDRISRSVVVRLP